MNFGFFLLFIGLCFTACKQESLTEFDQLSANESSSQVESNDQIQSRLIRECPRRDVETPDGASITNLATELSKVVNCGGHIALPDCGPDDLQIDETEVLVFEWCFWPSPVCDCVEFPGSFNVAEQDQLIESAKTLLQAELRACGLENSVISFRGETEGIVPCEYVKVRLYAKAKAYCCSNVG